jgi:hypothetical protein
MRNKSELHATMAATRTFNDDQVYALVQLFKLAPTTLAIRQRIPADRALQHGLVFVTPDGQLLAEIPEQVYDAAMNCYGNRADLFNQTFYKSFSTVRDANPLDLVLDQIMHYFTTYGAEALGLKIPTYVPMQELEIPETMVTRKGFKFVVIQFASTEDCIARLNKYLTTLTAPSPSIRNSIETLLPFVTLPTDDIKSFEIQVIQHKRLGTVPKAPVNQLRYLVYVTTGETLIIKNRRLRETIKSAAYRNGNTAVQILLECESTGLASIFLRYKPLFLAFKAHQGCAPLINRLRRLADTYHKPLSNVTLQNLTAITSAADRAMVISKASTRDLIKVLNSVRTRIEGTHPGVYAIRNGRTFVKEDGLAENNSRALINLGILIHQAIVARLRDTIGGKYFYMPDYIDYAVPTSEKQFVGAMPYGTCIYGPDNGAFTFGVQWFNQKGQRIDIDLHMNSATQHFGWNAGYRQGAEIIYTGDQTDAPLPKGAAEAFWFTPQEDDPYIVTANLYSGCEDCEYKIFMTTEKPGKTGGRYEAQDRKYTYNPNTALFPAMPMKFTGDAHAYTLGMFVGSTFYFYGGTLSNGIVPSANYKQFIEGLAAQLDAKVMIRDLIEECGGFIISDTDNMTTEELAEVISLAPEDLTVDTLLNIVDGVIE